MIEHTCAHCWRPIDDHLKAIQDADERWWHEKCISAKIELIHLDYTEACCRFMLINYRLAEMTDHLETIASRAGDMEKAERLRVSAAILREQAELYARQAQERLDNQQELRTLN